MKGRKDTDKSTQIDVADENVWQLRCGKPQKPGKGLRLLVLGKSHNERRAWTRLPLLIPLFVRGRDRNGKDFLEFASALNISAGGALLAVHGALRQTAQVLLEIPSAPLPTSVSVRKNSRNLRAKIVHITHADGFNLVGLRFLQPLLPSEKLVTIRKRKDASPV